MSLGKDRETLIVKRAENLGGKVQLKGAKNSILPIIAACVLTSDEVTLFGCPKLSDIDDMLGIISGMGGVAHRDGDVLSIRCENIDPHKIDLTLMSKIRSSVFILGPLLSRCGEAVIARPGGCEIGSRPIDIHLDGLKKLGVDIAEEEGRVTCLGKPSGGVIRLRYPSVGATENLIMAGAAYGGRTTIYGAAKEPEIVDLAAFLNSMGSRVYGAGGSVIIIDGKTELHGTSYKPIPDRIVAGTFIAATAVCGGDVFISGAVTTDLDATLYKFGAMGVDIKETEGGIRVRSDGRLNAVPQTVTLPYPGFSTDMQPLLVAALATADGTSKVTETLFENRFRYTYQLCRMGADIALDGENTIIINGRKLHGAEVYAQDLRGGAALIVAGLCAEGQSKVHGMEYVDRGYENIERDLCLLGASVKRTIEE